MDTFVDDDEFIDGPYRRNPISVRLTGKFIEQLERYTSQTLDDLLVDSRFRHFEYNGEDEQFLDPDQDSVDRTEEMAYDIATMLKTESMIVRRVRDEEYRTGTTLENRNAYLNTDFRYAPNGMTVLFPTDDEREIEFYNWTYTGTLTRNWTLLELEEKHPTYFRDQARAHKKEIISTARIPFFNKTADYISDALSVYMEYLTTIQGERVVSLDLEGMNINGRIRLPEGLQTIKVRNTGDLAGLTIPATVEMVEDIETKPVINGEVYLPPRLHRGLTGVYERSGRGLFLRSPSIDIRALDPIPTSYSHESIQTQLELLFPRVDPSLLEPLVHRTAMEIEAVTKVTDTTFSDAVFSYHIGGKRVYCKVGTERTILAREEHYYHDAWNYPVLRAITPKRIGLIETEKAAALLTFGTENIDIVDYDDAHIYFYTRNRLVKLYGGKTNQDPKKLVQDPLLIDVFNRALTHTYMGTYRTNPVYRPTREVIVPFERLVDRAAGNDLVKELALFEERYTSAAARYQQTQSVGVLSTVVHGDALGENIWNSPLGTRPLGDAGFAQYGLPEEDLARLDTVHKHAYVNAYVFFRTALEQERGANVETTQRERQNIIERVDSLAFIQAVRTASSKLSRNLRDAASEYISLAARL
ncbi:MAG: hypothetical protein AABX82_07160 [Nanoarchaeota archaeon]